MADKVYCSMCGVEEFPGLVYISDDLCSLCRARNQNTSTLSRPLPDVVNHPSHYTYGGIECIDALEAALGPDGFRAFCRGNTIKYLWRVGHKGSAIEDLKKARWYLDRYITSLEETTPIPTDRDERNMND